MIILKNFIFLKAIRIKFISYIKQPTRHMLTILTFKTKRIIVNKAPKHFNIGQHALKIRTYEGEHIYPLNKTFQGLWPQFKNSDFFNQELNLAKKLNIRSSKIYFTAWFKI